MAINFPTSPTNGDIHTAEGIQWKWDNTGSTWKCQGVTGVYTLGIASVNSLGGIKIGNNLSINGTGVLSAVMNLNNESISELTDVTFNSITLDGSNGGGKVLAWDQSLQAFAPVDQSGGGGGGGGIALSDLSVTSNSVGTASLSYNNSNGVFSYTPPDLSGYLTTVTASDLNGISIDALSDVDTTTTAPSANDVLTWDGSKWEPAAPSGGGGGSGLTSRTTANGTASNLADGGSANMTITAAKTYALLKIQTSHAAWVTLYTSTAARTADASRLEVTDPQPGSGVIAEIITTDGGTQSITPGTIGWNDDGTPSTNVYAKVVNKSGSTQNLTVTLHFVQLEV
tara:strand:+ start:44750 stop:45772 length:1023 start_codon:yes stop_codon:yes gene_type:complete